MVIQDLKEIFKWRKKWKRKEYHHYIGGIQFEGEYLNGIRQNGKIYNKEGNVEFVIKDGNGNGKE